jgi:hypothetical protein
MNVFLSVFLIVWVIARLLPHLDFRLPKIFRKKKIGFRNGPNVFEHHYLESKAFYVHRFKTIPSTTYVDDIDITRAFNHIQELYSELIVDIYQACFFNRSEKKQQFQKTLFVFKNKVIVEVASAYAKILYTPPMFGFAESLITALSEFKLPEKAMDFEINIITFDNNSLDLKSLPIKPTTLDLDLYYNDDFKEMNNIIRSRLSRQNDKGIVLLYGMPGTGKTTYLRHLIGELNKKVLFVSPSVAGHLMNPEFIDLLIDNPNAILIIEDAENIIMDRKINGNSSVSNLLNLSDGLLSDCLNVQIICTFNSSLHLIDSALMRKGRLIASYEFGKLSIEKAQALSDRLGFKDVITKPMTMAEIANQHEKDQKENRTEMIGFRRQEELMN